MGTTLGEREEDVTTGSRAGLEITLGDVATRRVGSVVAGTGETVGVMVVPWPARLRRESPGTEQGDVNNERSVVIRQRM